MKTFFAFLIVLASSITAFAGGEEGGIHWMTFDEVQTAMQKEPRRVFMDVYTDWCGWCKVMDRKTFSSPEVAAFINKNFYPVRFNAETDQPIRFVGKVWERAEGSKTNQLAIDLLRGQLSYPSTIIMEPGFQQVQAIPGYLDIPTIEAILTYIVGGYGTGPKAIPFPEFQKTYTLHWKAAAE